MEITSRFREGSEIKITFCLIFRPVLFKKYNKINSSLTVSMGYQGMETSGSLFNFRLARVIGNCSCVLASFEITDFIAGP